MSIYYDAYKSGYRSGEIALEVGAAVCPSPPPKGAHRDAWLDAIDWGFADALRGREEPASEQAVECFLDSEYCV